ncbi:tRNA 5-methylaminomethyl-2-thiouridine biosynthesis bifunctional protein [Desulfobotulus alkaliphilus]|uniref:tRNA 5-methylaminomethyl-2-thiouridine biosynthesis bifunctional protein n=1 Tax=Desulfobotulus alkaliphilus TaxID=622671 RepID=A0A562RD12_9BACT|nr:tRNA (5-methylaminomethyl-2-thiouridine)(34)-methyltransferase MnmD [Desulfobotulus alkaliphilus]TWI66932.1 tRNA 5-methylaminomethyl-2-thiouridine biosynthesis bifunctional protein [Desulfobotulus alkaliphilus]
MTLSSPPPSQTFCEALPQWKDENTLVSPLYNDSYFSKAGAMAESRHIFLKQNRLPHRWLEKTPFHICETGFGTGLNFLVTLDLWRRFRPAQSTLIYTSVEKHPIPADHLRQIHRAWPCLMDLSERLLEHYPPPVSGMHRLFFKEWQMEVNLLFDDAEKLSEILEEKVDAWFLDGFSPHANPEMWTDTLFETMGKKTADKGSFATFTAAGFVRRALISQGFCVEKLPGFSFKRDMIRGFLDAS